MSVESECFRLKFRQRLLILVEELLLKKGAHPVIACFVSPTYVPSEDLLDLATHLKRVTKADGLIVSNKSLEMLKSKQISSKNVVPLSEYRDSNFEKNRQQYGSQVGPIDTLPEPKVKELIIRSVRFATLLRFYDPNIGAGENTSGFRNGIRYILDLWREHGFFASQQGSGSVEIYTCSAERIRIDEEEHAKKSKLERNQENYRKVLRELIEPLNEGFPWPIKLFVKSDPDRIFHARYLETEHAAIQVERGFDFFKQNGEFLRNFFTLNTAERTRLKECRDLPDAAV